MTATNDLVDRVKAVHRAFPSGVAVVTTSIDNAPFGLAVNAFSSVSLEPPLVLVCVRTAAQTHDLLYRSDAIGISFLAHDQAAVASAFARSGGDKFGEVAWTPTADGIPILDGIAAALMARVEQRLRAGTHTIFIARVEDAVTFSRPPLLYHNGAFWDGAELQSAPNSSPSAAS